MAHETVAESFGRDVISQISAAKRIRTSSRLARRLDLRGKTVFTLTENAHQNAECAFSITRTHNGWQLGIHVADVSEYVCEDSPLDLEARRRFASVETEKGVSPMLPNEILELCCFQNGVDKLAVSMILDIDSKGNASAIRFEESVVCVSGNLVFSEIDQMEGTSDKSAVMLIRDKYSAFSECVIDMYELAALFCAKRRANGGLDCTVFRRVYEKGEDGKAKAFRRESEPDSRAMIREIGYFASAAVGRFMLDNALPCMFIGQETLPDNVIEYLYKLTGCESKETDPARLLADIADCAKGTELYGFVCDLISASLPCSVFYGKPAVNASCGYNTVISFVHPAHRYSDILTQRIIKETIAAKAKTYNLNINRYLKYVDRAAADASASERYLYDCRKANQFRLATEFLLNSDQSEFLAYPCIVDGNGNLLLFMECGLNAVAPKEYVGNLEFAVGSPISVEVITLGEDFQPVIVRPV